MWFDEIVPLLPYIRDVGGTKQSECPRCKGHVILEPFSEDHRQGNVKCIGTRGLNKCDWKDLNAFLNRMVAANQSIVVPVEEPEVVQTWVEAEENGHPPPEWQPPIATGGKKQRRPIELYTAADLVAMEFEEPKWAVPGYLCEGLNILAGAQKLGKSWLVLGTAIAVASGGRALGTIQVEEGDVLYLALEDTKRRLKDRLLKLLKEGEAPRRLTITNEWPRLDEGGLDWIRDWLAQNKAARLVIVDTLKKVRPPRGKGGSFYDEDYDVMVSLKEVADEFEVCMVAVHHVSKAVHEDVFNSVSGSMGLTGAADATLILERPRGSNAGALHITGRDVEEKAGEDAMSLEFCEVSGSWTLMGTVKETGKSDERRQIQEVAELFGKPISPKEVSDMLNKNASSTRWLMRKMAEAGDLRDLGNGKYIPPNTPNTPNASDEDEGDKWWIDH
jgi:hypothetical protein